ncbi:MAG TPA: DUF2934 domain-containing protein [Steroidobacteraceae bacterium]|nr:DUF2934 domain-containing protein [Steroidobacteraceae bacterium]
MIDVMAAAHSLMPDGMPASCNRSAALAVLFFGAQQRHQKIAETAYFRALRRGFAPGHELDDWLTAEAQVDAALTLGVPQ